MLRVLFLLAVAHAAVVPTSTDVAIESTTPEPSDPTPIADLASVTRPFTFTFDRSHTRPTGGAEPDAPYAHQTESDLLPTATSTVPPKVIDSVIVEPSTAVNDKIVTTPSETPILTFDRHSTKPHGGGGTPDAPYTLHSETELLPTKTQDAGMAPVITTSQIDKSTSGYAGYPEQKETTIAPIPEATSAVEKPQQDHKPEDPTETPKPDLPTSALVTASKASSDATVESSSPTAGVPEAGTGEKGAVSDKSTVISGSTYLLPTTGTLLVVDGTTIPLAPTTAPPPSAAIVTIGSETITANPASAIVINTQTLVPGGQVVESGTTYALGADGTALVIDGTATKTLTQTPVTLPTAYVVGSQTISAGASAITVSGVEVSLAPGAETIVVAGSSIPVSEYLAATSTGEFGAAIISIGGFETPGPSTLTSRTSKESSAQATSTGTLNGAVITDSGLRNGNNPWLMALSGVLGIFTVWLL